MADSIQNIDKKCIFRETFENEQSVRKNGGIPTDVIFTNGTVTIINQGAIRYNKFTQKGLYSIRVKFKDIRYQVASRYVVILWDKQGVNPNFFFGSNGLIYSTSGVSYANGIQSSTWALETTDEIVISGLSLPNVSQYITIGNPNSPETTLNCDISLFEIYQGTLTADEVKNLYENKRYREVSSHGEQLGAELNNDVTLDDTVLWSKGTGWTVANGVGSHTNIGDSSLAKTGSISTGKRYKIVYTINYTSGTYQCSAGGVTDSARTTGGTFTFYLTAVSTDNFAIYAAAFVGSIDNISIKEVLVNSTKLILDVNAFDGTVRNKLSGDSYVELLTNEADRTFSSDSGFWTKQDASITISNGICYFTGTTQYKSLYKTTFLKIGSRYVVTINVTKFTGTQLDVSVGTQVSNVIITGPGIYTAYGTVTAGDPTLYVGNNNTLPLTCEISDISVKEIIPSVIPTAVEVVKENDVWAMKFNGTTSKIDCGSYDGLVGDKTFVAWVKVQKDNGEKHLFTNMSIYVSTPSTRYFVSSNGGTTGGYAAVSSMIVNKWQQVVLKRTSTGLTTFYIDGVLNGTDGFASGTPVAGISNFFLGSTNLHQKMLFGSLKVYDGLLTPIEISQLYSNEKHLYSL